MTTHFKLILLFAVVPLYAAAQVAPPGDSLVLSLDSALSLLIANNPDIQQAKYEWLSKSEAATAAYGDFEPRLVGRLNKEKGEHSDALYAETKDEYKLGVEGKLPTGTSYNIGFDQVTYKHSDYTSEIYFGATLKQPVLRNFLYWAPMNGVFQARQEEEVAFQAYRKSIAEIIEKFCTSYWDYYYALKVLEFETESVAVAESISVDAEKQFKLGLLSAIDDEKTIAELSIRKSKQLDAKSNLRDEQSNFLLLLNDAGLLRNKRPLTIHPETKIDSVWAPDSLALLDSLKKIHPEILMQQAEVVRRKLVKDTHKSEMLPELNLTGSYGIRSRDDNANEAVAKFRSESRRDHVLSGGFEIEVPLFANHKERHLAAAENANVRGAEIRMQLLCNKIMEDNLVLEKRASEIMSQLIYEQTSVKYRKEELAEEFKKMRAGKSNYHEIFDIEEDLREAEKKEIEVIRMAHLLQIKLDKSLGALLSRNRLEYRKEGEIYLREDLGI